MMKDRSGKLASIIAVGLLVLPLLGLLIMDDELKRANDLTGAYISGGATGSHVGSYVIVGLGVVALGIISFGAVMKARAIKNRELAQINEEIAELDRKLR